MPDSLDEGVLYISLRFATVLHLCCCGCGNEVVTPLDPADWHLTFDGRSVSLMPSIGNWSFECQSHYWVSRNQVRWARQLSSREIRRVRVRDLIVRGPTVRVWVEGLSDPHAGVYPSAYGPLGSHSLMMRRSRHSNRASTLREERELYTQVSGEVRQDGETTRSIEVPPAQLPGQTPDEGPRGNAGPHVSLLHRRRYSASSQDRPGRTCTKRHSRNWSRMRLPMSSQTCQPRLKRSYQVR